MSREVRRVPLDWKHPTEYNPYWVEQQERRKMRGDYPSRLLLPNQRFVGLVDGFTESLEMWEEEGRELAARTGRSWKFSLEWHFNYDGCDCHEGESGVAHPVYMWDESGEIESPVDVRDEDHLHELLMKKHEEERPDPTHYMPVWSEDEATGWCLYETVSEGTPVTPVFETDTQLIEHLSIFGQDWDQHPMRRTAATALVNAGSSFGSLLVLNGRVLDSTTDADIIEGLK